MSLANTLRGVRVLDLGTNFAAPYCAMILGDLGAEVIKVERPPSGDDTRSLPPSWHGEATVFLSVNRNKRSVRLDLKLEEGRAALLRLAGTADVVVESFPPGYAAKTRLGFEDFCAVKPNIILCSMSAFGTGPLGAAMPGYDALVQAVSGMMSFTGHPNDAPVRIAPSVLDLTTGLWGAVGVQAALIRRAAGGGAEHVCPSLIDTAMGLMCHQMLGYLATGAGPEKLGSGAPSAVPYRVYAARDGAFMLATASDPQFRRLCAALGAADLAADPALHGMAGRLAQRDRIDAALSVIFARDTRAHWLSVLGGAGISAGAVNTLPEALDLPVVAERALLVDPARFGWSDGLPLLRLPIDPDGTCVRSPPPTLGADSQEILRGLGYTEAEIGRLSPVDSC